MKKRYDIYEIPEDQLSNPKEYLNDLIDGYDYPIIIRGNRDFDWKNSRIVGDIYDMIELALNNANGECYYLAQTYPSLTGDKLLELSDLCTACASCGEHFYLEPEQTAKWLTITFGEKYTYREIHDACKGDWQGVYLPESYACELPYIETCYFGMGYEWKVQCDGDEWRIYTMTDRREEVADTAGACATDAVHIYRINGSHTVTVYDYEEVQ